MGDVKLAVSLDDFVRVPVDVRGPLLAGRLDFDNLVTKSSSGSSPADMPAVVLACPLDVAASVADLMRSWDRDVGHRQARVHIKVGDSPWRAVNDDERLAVVVDGAIVFNEALLPADVATSAVACRVSLDDAESMPVR